MTEYSFILYQQNLNPVVIILTQCCLRAFFPIQLRVLYYSENVC